MKRAISAVTMPSPTMESNETGIVNWKRLKEQTVRNYMLDLMGLSTLKEMASTELTEETEEEGIPSEEEAARDWAKTESAWTEYLLWVRISQVEKVKAQQFMMDLINSSLCIKEQEDDTGKLCTSVLLNSGDLTLDWEELFQAEPTNIQALCDCLVYASIFIPAMVVKSYKAFTVNNILKLVSAPYIRVEWTASIDGRKKFTRLIVPKGEIQYFCFKAGHLNRYSQEWWMQLVKPMNLKYENILGISMAYQRSKFYIDGKMVRKTCWTTERIALFTVEIRILFYFYAKTVLSQKPTLWRCLRERLKALNLSPVNNMARGSMPTSTLQEYWYFKSQ